jgi:hypothetical protein
MEETPTIYIFAANDGSHLGLSLEENGRNLPSRSAVTWVFKQAVPMTVSELATHVSTPHAAIANLIMRGYHLDRMSAQVIRFPAPHRSPS